MSSAEGAVMAWLNRCKNIKKVIIPTMLIEKCKRYDVLLEDREFILFAECEYNDGLLTIKNEPLLYPQIITYNDVTPLWIPRNGDWALIHKHPYPFIRFSGTDEIYIYRYPLTISMLWCGGHVVCLENLNGKLPIGKLEIRNYSVNFPLSEKVLTEPMAELLDNEWIIFDKRLNVTLDILPQHGKYEVKVLENIAIIRLMKAL